MTSDDDLVEIFSLWGLVSLGLAAWDVKEARQYARNAKGAPKQLGLRLQYFHAWPSLGESSKSY